MEKTVENKHAEQITEVCIAGKKEVNNTFKLLSAIGILLIVSGHCYHGGVTLGYEWFPTYSYNLALFVFISGYFYKDKHEEHIGKYIWGRAKRLILPAYIWNILYGGLIIALAYAGFSIGAKPDTYNLFIMPFVDGEAFKYNLGSWFVYPLFCVYVFNILFRKLLKFLHRRNEFVILAVYLAIGMLGIYISNQCIRSGIHGPMKLLLRSMFFLPCFQFGRVYAQKLEKHDKLNNLVYFGIIIAIQLVLLTFNKTLEYQPSNCNFPNGMFITYISALTGIAFWLRVAKILTPALGNSRTVKVLGDNTYSLMIHHMWGFMCIKFIFWLISSVTPFFDNFNADLMKSNIWYYYLPNGMQHYAFLYTVGGILISLLIGFIADKLVRFLCVKFRPKALEEQPITTE